MYQMLLVEDDRQIREAIEDYFTEKGAGEVKLTLAEDGERGMELLYENSFDLIMLDIMLPGVDGFTLCREIRKNSIVPIIFLTAKGREADVLHGYSLGCDDYMIKPFSLAELYVKVLAMVKRFRGDIGTKILSCGDIEMDLVRYRVSVGEREVPLAPKEYALLRYLLENKGRVVSREMLLMRIWGYEFEGSERVVDNHIKKLRHALGSGSERIKTVFGQGYKAVE